jgi:hypothetical protein
MPVLTRNRATADVTAEPGYLRREGRISRSSWSASGISGTAGTTAMRKRPE